MSTPEPFQTLVHQGMVLGPDGRKMSKRRGNVIDPLDIIQEYSSDTLRAYLLFMGPVEQDKVWDDNTLQGVWRFLSRVDAIWTADGVMMSDAFAALSPEEQDAGLKQIEKTLHQTIKGVSTDMEAMKYNTVISKLMIMVNTIYEVGTVKKDQYLRLMQLLAPVAPTIAEQKRRGLGQDDSVFGSVRPEYAGHMLVEDEATIAIQINGKMRGTVVVDRDAGEDSVVEQAIAVDSVTKHLEGKDIQKVIFVPNKIVNLIVA
ncbi:MAG: class I tRNA ligase family protein [Candidatus Peribacteria bacterium]|nr:MAG: class I tRNA ligase family protein [Candidatus Peribacteria bacterium]